MGLSPAWRNRWKHHRAVTLAPEISGKQLELLKETVPKVSRVAVLTSSVPGQALQLREIGLAAGPLSVQLQSLDVLGPKDIETAFRAASDQRAEALIVLGGGILAGQRTRIVEFAVKSRLPAIYSTPAAVDAGGLMSYGVNQIDLDWRAAVYVDKILKGTVRRSSRGAADKVRVHHQSQSREADRPDDSAQRAGKSR